VVVDFASRAGVPERLVVGNERAFLTWFYEGATAKPGAMVLSGLTPNSPVWAILLTNVAA
jgi:hypothetical protein